VVVRRTFLVMVSQISPVEIKVSTVVPMDHCLSLLVVPVSSSSLRTPLVLDLNDSMANAGYRLLHSRQAVARDRASSSGSGLWLPGCASLRCHMKTGAWRQL
jgi:hypothetical protein